MEDVGNLVLALVLGAVIGLEREINVRHSKQKAGKDSHNTALLGLRTFSLISGLGALCGILYLELALMAAIIGGGFVLLVVAYYVLDNRLKTNLGFTTELAIFYSFVIGFMLIVGVVPAQLLVALTVVLVLLMSRKENIKELISDIDRHEMNAFVGFALLAFVILPFLPNETYALSDLGNSEQFLQNVGITNSQIINLELFNPFTLWFIVVLITGVDLLGYVLERLLGNKSGWMITSLIGGFVSSTATTISIAQQSKDSKRQNLLVAGALGSTLVSFVPIIFLLLTLNVNLLSAFMPVIGIILVSCLVLMLSFLSRAEGKNGNLDRSRASKEHKIFDLVSALRFMGIYLLISVVSKAAIEAFGNVGFLTTTAIGATTGLDAVVINIAQLVGNRIDMTLGLWALWVANTVNLLAKVVYAYTQGSKTFVTRFAACVAIVIVASLLGLLL